MPSDLSILKKDGYDQEKLKELFNKPWEKTDEKIQALITRQSDRIQRGVTRCLEDAGYFRALDDAYDMGQRQISVTMMRRLLSLKNASQPEVMKAATDWGLADMLVDELDKDGRPIFDGSDPQGSRTKKRLDLPVFFNVFIPLAMAYVKVRAAFLFNERDIWPPYKYEPQHLTIRNKVGVELLTQRVTRMHQEMGYRDIDRQSILAMLQYATCMNFPMEPFYQEMQPVMEGKEQKDKVIKEGVRYDIPHPTKVFWDEAWPLHTLNTDIGCAYVGHWKIQRFSDLKQNPNIWNVDKIEIGANSWTNGKGMQTYLGELYPCAVKLPTAINSDSNTAGREDKAFNYAASKEDEGVGTTVYFEKLNPKEEGLFDHNYPIWMRFIYAGDRTVIGCEPFAYAPGPVFLYDYDSNRWRNSSLLGELLPHQDHISNLFTQYLLQVKQSLDDVVFWNMAALSEDQIKQVQNLGSKRFSGRTYVPFDPRQLQNAGTRVNEAFFSARLPDTDTQVTLNAIMAAISLLERTLGFSAQEIGAASEYKPSATEVNVRVGASSTRLDYTGSFIDDAIHARKRRLYEAIVAYSTDDIFALVADLSEVDKKKLKEAGFEVEEGEGAKAGVKVKPSMLSLDGFVAQREGSNRSTDSQVAASMINIFQMIFASPDIVQSVGVKNLMKRFNEILQWAGVPGDWRFDEAKLNGNPTEDAAQATAQAQGLEQVIGNFMKPIVDGIAQRFEQQEKAATDALKQVVEGTAQGLQSVAASSAQFTVKTVQESDQQMMRMLDQKLAELANILTQSTQQALGEVRQEIAASQTMQPVPVLPV